MDTDELSELNQLRQLALNLASCEVYHADADGWEFCGVCGSVREWGASLVHEEDCPYLQALLWREAKVEKADRLGIPFTDWLTQNIKRV